MKKVCLSIGLNYVGTDYELPDCLKDMNDLGAIQADHGWHGKQYAEIDWDTLKMQIQSMAGGLSKSDIFGLFYSGHGTQIPTSRSNEPDGFNEGIVLFTRENGFEVVVDDRLAEVIAPLRCNVFFYFDSCFAGGMTRDAKQPKQEYKRKFIPFEALGIGHERVIRQATTGPIIDAGKRYRLFACKEDQTAASTGTNGLFTLGILSAYKTGKRKIGDLYKYAFAKCIGEQSPVLEVANNASISKYLF